ASEHRSVFARHLQTAVTRGGTSAPPPRQGDRGRRGAREHRPRCGGERLRRPPRRSWAGRPRAARPPRPGRVAGRPRVDRVRRRHLRRVRPRLARAGGGGARRRRRARGPDDGPRGAGGRCHRHRGRPPRRGRAVSPSRREERRGAAFLLYQKDLTGGDFRALYDAYERDNGGCVTEFVRAQAEGTWADRERLDRSIDAASEGWSADRMAVLERNILRLAVWEIGRGEVPVAVAI